MKNENDNTLLHSGYYRLRREIILHKFICYIFLGVKNLGYTFKPVGLLKTTIYKTVTYTTPFKCQPAPNYTHQRFFFPCFVYGQDVGKYGIILFSLDNYSGGGQENSYRFVGDSDFKVTLSTNGDSYNVVTITLNTSSASGWIFTIIPWVALTASCYSAGAYSGGDFS